MSQITLHIIALIAMGVPTVTAYTLVFGKAKILHFGQLAFSIVGAYVLWVLAVRYGFSIPAAFACSLLAVVFTAALFAWLSLRLTEDAFGVMSIAVHLMLLAVVLNWQSVTRGALGVPGIPRFLIGDTMLGFTLMSVCLSTVWCIGLYLFNKGPLGRAIAALSEHTWHAQSLGIERTRLHFILFVIAGIGALLVNMMFHSYLRLLSPIDFQFPAMIFYVMVVVAGGPGNLLGSVLSLAVLITLRESLRFLPIPIALTGPLELILFGVVLLVAVWFRRDTLFPKQRSI